MPVLMVMFAEHLISTKSNIPKHAHSSNLTPCDIFLWNYVKPEVCKHRPRNLETLKKSNSRRNSPYMPKIMWNFSFCLETIRRQLWTSHDVNKSVFNIAQ